MSGAAPASSALLHPRGLIRSGEKTAPVPLIAGANDLRVRCARLNWPKGKITITLHDEAGVLAECVTEGGDWLRDDGTVMVEQAWSVSFRSASRDKAVLEGTSVCVSIASESGAPVETEISLEWV